MYVQNEEVPVSSTDLEEIISKGFFRAPTPDLRSLMLGDRKVFGNGFDKLLLSLSLVPAGSVKTLNIIAYCTSVQRLDFIVEFNYRKDIKDLEEEVTEDPGRPLQSVELNELINILPEINVDGVSVKLNDVRKAFPVDGEVHVFNMLNSLREEFVQALANVFQVRTTGFTEKPVRVDATVITENGDESPIVSKKVDVGFLDDPSSFQADFFSQLLELDRAQTGLFTAFPRRQ